MPDQAALLAQSDLGAEPELARLADVVQDRRRHQQVGVEPAVQVARLLRERRDSNRVLQQPTEVGVVTGARAGRAAELGAEAVIPEEGVDEPPQAWVVHLASEVL